MPSDSPEYRASHADRERVAAALRDALDAGQLSLHEFDERLKSAYQGCTHAELDELTQDLPRTPPPIEQLGKARTSARALGIFGRFSRRGSWRVPQRFTAITFCGSGRLDLCSAHFEHRDIVIRCVTIMGRSTVIVGPEVELEVTGTGIMGGFKRRARGRGQPGGPRIVVTGLALWGGVRVQRRTSKASRKAVRN